MEDQAAEKFTEEPEMLLIRDETPWDIGQVQMLKNAAVDRHDRAFGVPVLIPEAMGRRRPARTC